MPDPRGDSNDKTLLRPVDEATVRLTESDTRTHGRGTPESGSQPTLGRAAAYPPAPGPVGTPFGRYRLLSELRHGDAEVGARSRGERSPQRDSQLASPRSHERHEGARNTG